MPPNVSSDSSSTVTEQETSCPCSADSTMSTQCSDHCCTQSDSNMYEQTTVRCRNMMRNVINRAENVEKSMILMMHNAWNVCHFQHLPKWLQDNDYLHSGHRPPLASFQACFWSIFRLHTETLNIWTHGVGCVSFIIMSVYLFIGSSYSTIPVLDKFMLGIFLTTAIICLGLSACYHTLSCHSYPVCDLFSKLDYCGISLLIAGSIVPCLYYGFYCNVLIQVLYTSFTVVLCIASVIVSLWDKFSEAQYRPLRAGVFTSFAFSSIVPAVHWYISNGAIITLESSLRSAIYSLGLVATLYLIGVLFYALRIPERFYPGKFDLYFHSHQLFHIFVFAAAVTHLQGITTMADFRLYSQQAVCTN